MITISLHPTDIKKVILFVVGLICISSAACFAESTLLPVPSTPYDKQMIRIHSVLSSTVAAKSDLSLALINHWIGDLRTIPYGFSAEWKTPSEVQSGPAADCKGKAVALYQKMRRSGAKDVRLVIGRRTAASSKTHAWLEWNNGDGTYVLDPTINWAACRADAVGSRNYIPLYAYAGVRKYRASTATLYAKN